MNQPTVLVDPSGHCIEEGDAPPGSISNRNICHSRSNSGGSSSSVPDSPGCGIAGNGPYGFHCTEDDIRNASLSQRLTWFQWLRGNMSQNIRPDAGDWFRNIATVVAGFDVTGQDSDQWVLNVDATILVEVQNGYAASLNHSQASGAANLWKAFFDTLGSQNPDPNQLIQEWDEAEKVATKEGTDKYGDWWSVSKNADRDFLLIGGLYRGAGNTVCRVISCVGGFFDPRATFGQVFGFLGSPYNTYNNMSPVAAALGPIYVFDYMGIP